MKKLFAMILALLMLTACAAEKPQPRQELPDAEAEIAAEAEITEEETEQESVTIEPQYSEETMEYTSLMVDGGVEDTVGFSFEIPEFDCPGKEAISRYFDGFVQNLERFTEDVVYENAMERSCIVSVYGKVLSAVVVDDILAVTYSYECHYSDVTEPEEQRTVLRFDLATGEPME